MTAGVASPWKGIMLKGKGLFILLIGLSCISDYGQAMENKKRSFEMTYTAVIKDLPSPANKVEVWLPYPQDDENQTIIDAKVVSPSRTSLRYDAEYGNAVLHMALESPESSTITVQMKFKVIRSEALHRSSNSDKNRGLSGSADRLQRFLRADRLVPIDEGMRELAIRITQDKELALDKARAIYDYVLGSMVYDKSGVGWGRGDALYACQVGRGNCTDYHSLFIALSRAVNIPAKFEIGFPLPSEKGEGEIKGYHCWAQFYLPGNGWIPTDISEADKDPSKKDYFFGALSEDRILFTVGRDILLEPAQKNGRLNYFIYPYVEVDGKPFAGVETEFYFREL